MVHHPNEWTKGVSVSQSVSQGVAMYSGTSLLWTPLHGTGENVLISEMSSLQG